MIRIHEVETTDQSLNDLAKKYEFTLQPSQNAGSTNNAGSTGLFVSQDKIIAVGYNLSKNSVVIQIANNTSLTEDQISDFLNEFRKAQQLLSDFKQTILKQ